MPVRILVADDSPTIRALLRRVLEEHSDWIVCGEAENGNDAVIKTEELTPDVVILDWAMPQMAGPQAAREIAKKHPEIPMLLLTVQDVSQYLVEQAKRAGFRGAISKVKGIEVVPGVEALLRQETFFLLHDSSLQQ